LNDPAFDQMAQTPKSFVVDSLRVRVCATQDELVQDAARETQSYLQQTLLAHGRAAAVLATGNSQIKFLSQLAKLGGVDWSKITLFHMDEYLGISTDHPASFRRYLRERVEQTVRPRVFHYLEGDALLPIRECERYSQLLRAQPIDLCCLGIGENGHLAFNDPPVADFNDNRFVKIVKLDDACKRQQAGEGHFPDLESVPSYALTLTIPALISARKMVCIVPEKRKAVAVKAALQGPIGVACPASVLRKQAHCTLFLDAESASLL
jgi:glucosamine-6-phosphate deaminase